MKQSVEEMAEEYASKIYQLKYYVDGRRKHSQGQEGLVWLAGKNGFLAGYKAAQQWISVKDRLPEVGKEILWYHQPGGEFAVGYLLDEATQPFFTHWMPLPAPPKEDE